MPTHTALVGRRDERAWLLDALERTRTGAGSLVLLSGEAGIGKTRLIEDLASEPGLRVLRGCAGQRDGSAYGPIVTALRSELRTRPDALAGCGPLHPHLALILPELGRSPDGGDRATLDEALRQALAHLARDAPVLMVLDDLQWSDETTLESLPSLAESLGDVAMLVIASYRSDGLPREHLLRRVRHDLRRAGRLVELTLAPLGPDETAKLAGRVLGESLAPSLARSIYDRSQGVPFFVQELASALATTGAIVAGAQGLVLAGDGEVPVPATVRDAVLISASEMSVVARATADVAAVAGAHFDLEIVVSCSSIEGLDELVERGWVREDGAGGGSFRHALVREALYADVPWLQRRALHRRLAMSLELAGASAATVAVQWNGASDAPRAREALLRAVEEARTVSAYRDAARAGRQALDLWPDGEETDARLAALESYAANSEMAGELAEAARAWRELVDLHSQADAVQRLAEAQRRLACVHDLRGDRDAAFAARIAAAEAYAAAEQPADAATERLGAANYLRLRAEYTATITLTHTAQSEADRAGRPDLKARALGLEGVALAKRGDHGEGLEAVRAALSLALEHELTPVAAELYQRLSIVIYDAGDYRRAEAVLDSALELCRPGENPAVETACVTCMLYVLRECGEWSRALELGRKLILDGTAVWVAEGLIGSIYGFQGRFSAGRRLLVSSLASSSRASHYNMTVDSTVALAWIAAAEGSDEEAARRFGEVLVRWERSEDHHYAVRGLRCAAAFFARTADLATTDRCCAALARIASRTGHPDALAALAHAIGEAALATGDAETAAEQLRRASDLHESLLDIPLERTEIGLRTGVALAAAGDRAAALEHLVNAYRAARRLGSRPLVAEAAREVARLGESVAKHLGRRAQTETDGAGLSRRELEVVRLIATGRTNRAIAHELYLSPRTIDMHVRSILRRLDCRSRLEAARKAGELGLLD